MTEEQKTEEKDVTTERLDTCFQQGKQALYGLLNEPTVDRKMRYRLAISLVSMLVSEIGYEMYPSVTKRTIHGIFNDIETCITEMHRDENEDEECDLCEIHEDDVNFHDLLKGLSEKVKDGKAKVKIVKVKA